MQYKKVEKIIENGKHKLLYEGMFVEDDPDYYEPEVEPEISEEKIPMFWREDLLLSKKWFDDIRDTTPIILLMF